MVTGRKYRVYSQSEYDALKKRVEAGAKFLEGKWFDAQYLREQAHYNEMAMSLYLWDLDHGIIEAGIKQMIANERREHAQTNPRPQRGGQH